MKKIFQGLAEDEQRHYEIIRLIQRESVEKVQTNPLLSTVQNVFTVNTKPAMDNPELLAKLKSEQIDEGTDRKSCLLEANARRREACGSLENIIDML
ncbi:hypothetical protein P22_1613 [Propionispora sp. 2/2-37]|uniref:hypothetical protein n=1 Tax=Propionispora sp. 2/2-37 TaxID=1677858 RepID=UPI0006BB77BF|nr:hypothetical protein [Propionispora sp. 2/2-37]CUH95542.1 hypothetical protein P22_1613 [Propionispora sp. 2/2-37]